MNQFNGFNSDIYNFFKELSENNSKEWFDLHRPFYEKEIKTMSKSFIESMKELFYASKLDYVADPKFNLFRINRDIRFSPNKKPYKTNLGIFFPHRIDVNDFKKTASGVYIHFGINECFIATGMFNPQAPLLKLIRKKIANNWYDFEHILNNAKFKEYFPFEHDKDNVAKKVMGYNSDNPAYEYLKKKTFTYHKNYDNSIFYSDELIQLVLKSAESSQDFSIFLNDVLLELE
ncbi:MAG TPA: DUF2461 domain-containing protein [Candidatus Kapabacteria bacterium]|nr:DUF2461 domain-containing protein [Candidatus Kapabacteria bacterium]